MYQAYIYYTVYTDDGIHLKLYVRNASLVPMDKDKAVDTGLQITFVLCVWCSTFDGTGPA